MLVFNVLNGLNPPPKFLFKYISCYCSTNEAHCIYSYLKRFKYISCYCSTLVEMQILKIVMGLNTYHVIVQ